MVGVEVDSGEVDQRRSMIDIVLTTTMSTCDLCNAVTRSAADRIRYSTCDGTPREDKRAA